VGDERRCKHRSAYPWPPPFPSPSSKEPNSRAGLGPGPAALARTGNPGVIPPQATPYGKSYAAWAVAWQQWGFAQPVHTNPQFDTTGAFCAEDQQGPVWFLAGFFLGGVVHRDCAIPAGKALFFPILNGWEDNIGVDPPLSADQLKAACNALVDDPQQLGVIVDGVALVHLDDYRVATTLFNYTVPEDDSILDFLVHVNDFPTSPPPPGAASCGYYVMLTPLTPGQHTLEIVANHAGFDPLDVTYTLTVGSRGDAKPTHPNRDHRPQRSRAQRR
jgi:hypothetical protein